MKLNKVLRYLVRRIGLSRPKPLILMYHRIARDPIDIWDLAVSPENFAAQLAVLRRTRLPMSLGDFVRHLVAGTLPSNAVAVTFDDGYVDNLLEGKPRLSAAEVPATIFLATGYLGHSGEFWWDEFSRLILAGQGPRILELVLGEQTIHLDRGASAVVREDGSISEAALRHRHAELAPVWETMRRLDDNERQAAMAKIRSVLSDGGNVERGRAMTQEEVQALIADGLVTIGAHTVTHPLLTALDTEACQNEIAISKSACEAIVDTEIAGFAYPYGGFDEKARQAVSAAGFAYACSTQPAAVGPKSDLLALPRIHVRNWDGDAFERAIDAPSPGTIHAAYGALRATVVLFKAIFVG